MTQFMKLMKQLLCCLLLWMTQATATATPNDSIPGHQSFTLLSKHLGEQRVINVWTPADYSVRSTALPVMYMADGGIQEDFPEVARTFSTLIEAKKIPPFILVGIENTQRRRDLTGFTTVGEDREIAPIVGESESFRAFVNDELFAQIAQRYKTTGKRGILGESLAGLFVVETLLYKPEMFDYYIAFDPSLWWNDVFLVRHAAQQLPAKMKTKKTFWFTSSDNATLSQLSLQLSQVLTTQKIARLKWLYTAEPNENHQTIFSATKEKALIWTLNP
ncbi:alpha/beta hydrolase [Flavobacterium sp. JP2137]|uniref:alpha/beta hydrolase n=1 Tax=Flavobacterium sp. JP2137 TaxID=3414510 RepID=UPI003D2FBD65